MIVAHMTPFRRGLAVALVALCGILFLSAGRAQAHEWKVNGSTLSKLEIKEQPFSISGVPINFVWTFGEVTFRWTCELNSEKGVLTQEGKGTVTLKFQPCFLQEPSEATGCKIVQVAGTGAVKFELVESESVLYEKFTPVGAKLFEFQITGCMIFSKFPIEGSFAVKAKSLFEEKVEQPWETNAEINSAVGAKLSSAVGKVTPTMSGSGIEKLTGAKEGSTLSAS